MDYLISILPQAVRNIPIHMDLRGQQKAERYFQIIITVFAVVGFVWGYICQYFSQTMYIVIAGFVLSCLLTLPPWPMYRRNPLKWQPIRTEEDDSAGGDSKGGKTATKSKKKK